MILITGGTGLVGSHLAYDLLKKGYAIKILVRESSDRNSLLRVFRYYDAINAALLFSKIHWVVGDLTNRFSLDAALEDVDIVYHTAAKISFQRKHAREILDVNVQGTADLIDRCLAHKISKFCYVSSASTMGVGSLHKLTDESSFLKPEKGISSYEFSKFSAEMEVWRGITEGLDGVIVNPSVILGPGFWKKGSNELFTFFAKRRLFYTGGISGFVDVRDVSYILVQLIEKKISGERFILNSGNISFQNLMVMIAKEMGISSPRYKFPVWAAETIWRACAVVSRISCWNPGFTKNVARAAYKKDLFSNEKIKKYLTFEFRPLSETIRDLSLYYKQDFTTNS